MRQRSLVAVVITLLLASLAVVPANATSSKEAKATATHPTWLMYNAKAHSATITMIAAYDTTLSGFNFDGYGQGKMTITLPVGTKVTVKFTNKGPLPHSWMVTPFAKHTSTTFPVAIKGAATSNPTAGTPAGKSQTLTFTATPVGKYAMVCAVPGHAAAGMWNTLIIAKGGEGLISFGNGGSGTTTTSSSWLAYDAKAHTATLTMVAAYNTTKSGFNFDGYSDGKMVVTIPQGTKVTVKFTNKGPLPHSWVLTKFANHTGTSYPAAIKGAATKNPTAGSPAGTSETLTFTATPVGKYAMVCAVPGHDPAGMWDTLVIASGGSASVTPSK